MPVTAPRWRWPTARSAHYRPRPAPRPAQRVGAARATSGRPLAARQQPSSKPSVTQRVLVDEAVDVTLPWDRRLTGARHPLTTIQESLADVFTSNGLRQVAEGPEVEAEWFNFDALNIGPDHPVARRCIDTFFVGYAGVSGSCCARTRPRCRSGRCSNAGAADLRRLPGQGVPHRRARRHAHAGVPPDRGPGGRRGHHHGPPQGHARPHGRSHVRRRASSPGCARHYFPFTEPSAEIDLLCFVCRGESRRQPRPAVPHVQQRGLDRVGRLRHGQPARAASPAASTPTVYTGFAFGMGIERTHDVPQQRRRHARHGRGRHAVHPGVRDGGMRARRSAGSPSTPTCRTG